MRKYSVPTWGTLSHVPTSKRNYFVVVPTVERPFAVAACAHIDCVALGDLGTSNIMLCVILPPSFSAVFLGCAVHQYA